MKLTAPGKVVAQKSSGRWQVTFRGQQVRNPVLRSLIIAVMLALVPFLLVFTLVLCFFVALPLGLLLDKPLKACGRRGCVDYQPNGKMAIHVDGDSFRRRPPTAAELKALEEARQRYIEPGPRSRPSGLS